MEYFTRGEEGSDGSDSSSNRRFSKTGWRGSPALHSVMSPCSPRSGRREGVHVATGGRGAAQVEATDLAMEVMASSSVGDH